MNIESVLVHSETENSSETIYFSFTISTNSVNLPVHNSFKLKHNTIDIFCAILFCMGIHCIPM